MLKLWVHSSLTLLQSGAPCRQYKEDTQMDLWLNKGAALYRNEYIFTNLSAWSYMKTEDRSKYSYGEIGFPYTLSSRKLGSDLGI